MKTTSTTSAAPGRANEDYATTGTRWALLLDGATRRSGVESGCVHDVPWLVSHLGGHLAWTLGTDPTVPLAKALAAAINATRAAHGSSCDLDNPDSPSSTVTILRQRRNGQLDYLVLGDSPLIVETVEGGLVVIADERSGRLPSYTPESVRAFRNHPDGFWIASTDERAAAEAMTGVLPAGTIRRALLLTDGVTRYVERLGMGTWRDLFDDLVTNGAADVIARIRAAEEVQFPEPVTLEPSGRQVKRHDDATAVVCTPDGAVLERVALDGAAA